MIPQLPRDQTCSTLLGTLFRKLQEDGFEGVLSTSESSRVLAANDNSIWEQMPSAVIAPRTTGYSCQVQASRIEHLSLRHPLEIIGKS